MGTSDFRWRLPRFYSSVALAGKVGGGRGKGGGSESLQVLLILDRPPEMRRRKE